ncbi:MAG: ABC transporter substrate-binding protein, partial [Sporichthyaceae bacterium]|nr:ABC transporter substrate-binding protein [Sporichthyaceae bacterium]
EGPLANDPRVRKALELSIDRDTINQVVFNGLFQVSCSPISADSPFATPGGEQCAKRDPAEAKRLLGEAGVKIPLRIELITDNSPIAARLGQAIQSMAKEGGFDVKLKPTEFSTALDETDAGKFQAFQIGWSGRVDPDGNISNFHLSTGSQNISRAGDKQIDDLINQARTVNDLEQRKQLYEQVIKAVQERRNLIYLYRVRNFIGASRKVTGVQLFPDALIRVAFAGYVTG